jgi:NAD(P)-dependent dehydrogenase (short-subunit alcohol dehydrogenase family)
MGLLDGRVAIVTGGARGIGARYCHGLATEGALVMVADINEAGARQVASEIGGASKQVDVADAASVQAMVSSALEAFGRVDILINNAAIFTELLRPRKPFDEIPVEEWDRVMAVNVRGAWLCSRAVAPTFRRLRSGVIINISSGTIFNGRGICTLCDQQSRGVGPDARAGARTRRLRSAGECHHARANVERNGPGGLPRRMDRRTRPEPCIPA